MGVIGEDFSFQIRSRKIDFSCSHLLSAFYAYCSVATTTYVFGFCNGVSSIIDHHDDVPYDDPQCVKKLLNQDEDIFQTARLINCSWFGSAIFSDYFRSILGPLHMRLFPDQVHANTGGGFMPYTNSYDPDFSKCPQCIAIDREQYDVNPPVARRTPRFVCSISTRTAFNCNSMGFMVSMGFDPIRKYQIISNVVPVL